MLHYKSLFLLIFLSIIGLSSFHAQAAQDDRWLFVQGGAIATNVGIVATEDDARARFFNSVYPSLGFRFQFGKSKWKFTPSLQASPLGRMSADEAARTYIFKFVFPASIELPGPFDFAFGPGVFTQVMIGQAGAVELKNGTSTQTFFRPARNVTSRVLILEANVGIQFGSKARLDIECFSSGFLSARRAFNLGLFLGWGIY